MLLFKSCPRCGGDVHVDSDWYGEYKNCLQCGWSLDTASDRLSSLAKNLVTSDGELAVKQAS